MRTTIKDIAKIAGVSHSTVSRSLNDSNLISDETKKKIKKIAKEEGFEFNASARSLVTRKTETIALIYPENFDIFSINLFFSSIINHIREALEKEGMDLITTFSTNDYIKESNIQKLIRKRKVDGFIFVQSIIDQADYAMLKNSAIPFVFLHLRPELDEAIDCFYTDHYYGGYLATEYLIKLGHKKISVITNEAPEFVKRLEGYKKALVDNNIEYKESNTFYGDLSFEHGYNLAIENYSKLNNNTAIFVQSDLMALGVIRGLKEKGIRIPEDISVIGYDDIELATYYSPKLSTIHQPRRKIAALASQRIVELINNKGKKALIKENILKPELVIRESCRKI